MIIHNIKQLIEGKGDNFSKRRNTQIVKTITSGVAAKVVSMATGLVTIPITLNYLGIEQFGIWMAITSFVGFLSFTDLGLGFGLQNALSRCFGKDDNISPKAYISNAYFIVILLSTFVLATGLLLFSFLPIDNLAKVKTSTDAELFKTTFFMVFFISLVGIPSTLIQRILRGYQRGNVASVLNLIGSILALLTVFISVYLELSLPILVTLFIGAPLLINFVYSIGYFLKNINHRPDISLLNISLMKEVSVTGLWALLSQVIYLMKVNVPVFILSFNIGMAAVAQYSTTQKVFGIFIMMTTMAVQALWPAYGEAYHRGDKEWMHNTFIRSIKIVTLITIPVFLFFCFLGIPIIELWTGNKDVLPSLGLLMACNVAAAFSGFNTSFVMVANGTSHFKENAIFGFVTTLIGTIIAFWISSISESVQYTIWVFAILCDATPTLFYYQVATNIIKKMDE